MKSLICAGAIAAAIAVAGCGGGGDDGGKTEKLSHEALVTQANAACRTAAASVGRIPSVDSIEGLADYSQRVSAIGTRLYGELTRLTPSQPDETSYTRFLDALRTSNSELVALERAADAGDRRAVAAAARRVANAEPGTYAAVIGLDVCAAATPSPGS
jgi:hypothetical protein